MSDLDSWQQLTEGDMFTLVLKRMGLKSDPGCYRHGGLSDTMGVFIRKKRRNEGLPLI